MELTDYEENTPENEISTAEHSVHEEITSEISTKEQTVHGEITAEISAAEPNVHEETTTEISTEEITSEISNYENLFNDPLSVL